MLHLIQPLCIHSGTARKKNIERLFPSERGDSTVHVHECYIDYHYYKISSVCACIRRGRSTEGPFDLTLKADAFLGGES